MKDYVIRIVKKSECEDFLNKHHYINKQGGSFKSGINYGLFFENILIGVAIFNGVSVPETVKGCFGLDRNKQKGIFELGRLAIDDSYYEKNLTSWFLSRSIKMLKKKEVVRAILTYADSKFHIGYVYQALSFKYYGLTNPKKDFYILQTDGSYKKHNRGSVRELEGEWRERTRKHRYLIVYDKSLKCRWKEEKYPKGENLAEFNNRLKEVIT